MDRAEALRRVQKTTDTTEAAGGLLAASQSRQFVRRIAEKIDFSKRIRVERRRSATGEINKMYGNRRVIRKASENSDDGYRAGMNFPTVEYAAQKVRLPWEVTEDVFHENIEGEAVEPQIVDEMELAFAEDLEDLDFNGDTTSADPFVQINDGVLKQIADDAYANVHEVDGSTINGGDLEKGHFFAAKRAMPFRYRADRNLVWALNPDKADEWTEYLTDRATAAGDAALLGDGEVADKPLRVPFVLVPSLPTTDILLLNPRNVVRVITWDIRRRRITGDTDKELAATDKRFYVFHLKHDTIIEELDAVVHIHSLN